MAIIEIEIIPCGNSYCAPESYVNINDTVKIKTNVPKSTQTFRLTVPNTDGFFSSTLPAGSVVDDSTIINLGSVTGNGRNTKYFEIDPGIFAPPRIIRVGIAD